MEKKNAILMGCTCGRIRPKAKVTIYILDLQKNDPDVKTATVEFQCRCGAKSLYEADEVEIK